MCESSVCTCTHHRVDHSYHCMQPRKLQIRVTYPSPGQPVPQSGHGSVCDFVPDWLFNLSQKSEIEPRRLNLGEWGWGWNIQVDPFRDTILRSGACLKPIAVSLAILLALVLYQVLAGPATIHGRKSNSLQLNPYKPCWTRRHWWSFRLHYWNTWRCTSALA